MTDVAIENTHKEKHGFQTEVNQLLKLMIHSLYSNQEIFLRELISNASDALDKLRFQVVSNANLAHENTADLKIRIEINKENNTVSIIDNGVGMSRDDAIEHLGTIAKSGTKQFLEALTGDQARDSQMIGQFGVGFYSSFMVADKVVVTSRKAGLSEFEAVRWESEGNGEYTVETVEKAERGTTVTLYLKKEAEEFLDHYRIKNIIQKYSDHIALPIEMEKQVFGEEKKEEADKASETNKKPVEYEVVNKATALWTRPKSEITPEEYKEFYKAISYDYSEPLTWTHNKVEGNQQFVNLLYIPKRAPFDLWDRERKSGLKLYVRRVFIMDNADMLPPYLRFVKGVIDSNDLPLNVSREILQNNKLVEKIKSSSVKKVLQLLEKMANSEEAKDKEQYEQFWDTFGAVLKEGPVEDYDNAKTLYGLMRFASTHDNSVKQKVSLKDYIARMKPGQKEIYYLTAESHAAAVGSPHLEFCRKKNIEVLLLSDRVDEWLLSSMTEFEDKKFKSVAKGKLDLEGLEETAEEKETHQAQEKDFESVVKQMKEALGARVSDVRVTHRLTDSPACVVTENDAMSLHLQRMMAQAGQKMPTQAPVLEINPEHALMVRLKNEPDDLKFKEWSNFFLEQALLTEGGQLEDPIAFVKRMNKLLEA